MGRGFGTVRGMSGDDQGYPPKLREIIELFEMLPDQEKRENLIAYADQAEGQKPAEGESFDLEDVRKDEECTDTVGVFLRVDAEDQVDFRITLGAQVQTLTRAMTAILCQGLNGSTLQEVIDVPQDFVPRVVGQDLVRLRSQTIYYVLGRMKGACKAYQRRRAA